MSRLAFGIPTQTGAQAFKREVEQSLACWRDMIEKDDARVVRSIHIPPAPNSIDGPMPVTIYQIAVRATGRVSNLSIQGKHNPLPTPISNWVEAPRSSSRSKSRSRSDSEGKLAAKRRLQAVHEEEQAAAAAAAAAFADDTGCAVDDSGFDTSYEFDGENELNDCKADYVASKKARFDRTSVATPAHCDNDYIGDMSMNSVPGQFNVHLHPPTPRKPSRPSSRRPPPVRYSIRTRSASMLPDTQYGLDDMREPAHLVPPSTAHSEIADTASQTANSEATRTTYTLRRSSRLASMAPEGEHDALMDATTQLHGVELASVAASQDEPLDDVDMSSMIIDYEDPEEARLAEEQEARERAWRHEDAIRHLPSPPRDYGDGFGVRRIKKEPGLEYDFQDAPHAITA